MSSRRTLYGLAGILAMALSACASNAPQDFLQPEGPEAKNLDELWDIVFVPAAVVFFLILGLVGFVVFKFRDKGDDRRPKQVHGNARLEIGWTVVPALLLAVIGFATVGRLFDLARAPEDALEVKVIGHQFWWEYQYPEFGITTANELHIPTGRPVRLAMSSAETALGGKKGVIHSYWIPKLAGKQDVVPGRINYLNIEATEPGRYQGQCVEFCGVSHANMRAFAVAHEPADFQEWVEGQQEEAAEPTSGLAAEGFEVFASAGCAGCHTIKGYEGADGTTAEGKNGPDLTHLKSREVFAGAIFEMNDRNLRKWLRDPPGEKPMNLAEDGTPVTGMPNLQLTEEQITKLIAYLNTLE